MKSRYLNKTSKTLSVLSILVVAASISILNYFRPEGAGLLLAEGVYRHNVSLTTFALKIGADPNFANEYHVSVLGVASGQGDREIVDVLLARGANPDVRDYQGKPAIDTISDPEIVKLLHKRMNKGKK